MTAAMYPIIAGLGIAVIIGIALFGGILNMKSTATAATTVVPEIVSEEWAALIDEREKNEL